MVSRADVITIVQNMLVGASDPDNTGIELTFDPSAGPDGQIKIVSVNLASMSDLSAILQEHLQGQPNGQYWLVFNKES